MLLPVLQYLKTYGMEDEKKRRDTLECIANRVVDEHIDLEMTFLEPNSLLHNFLKNISIHIANIFQKIMQK